MRSCVCGKSDPLTSFARSRSDCCASEISSRELIDRSSGLSLFIASISAVLDEKASFIVPNSPLAPAVGDRERTS